ncbi:stage II sporulation protein D [Geobacillus sp. Manikaran-105]|uniref:stage II sporulation protein D n=1 Tax=Geobacillus sp. Manikaran-105 TaxID=2055940 RepID=UPI000C28CC21|nr:stage II sporulation protein D [Geobacillus sp. Manikaran-105]PJW15853.1 stage II sporulation protein D [Geobacillus sp. Manikaran-105]
MDKQRLGITVNINGQSRPFTIEQPSDEQQDEPGGQKHRAASPTASSVGGTSVGHLSLSPRQGGSLPDGGDATDRGRNGGQETEVMAVAEKEGAAAMEADEPIFSVSEAVPKKKVGKTRRPWLPSHVKPLFLAAAVAALVGMAFGMVMLRLVPKEKAEPSPAAEALTELTEDGAVSDGGRAESELPAPFSVAVIQAGVYSNADSAARAAESIRQADVPVVVAGKQPAALYIAVGADKEALRAVNDQYRGAVPSTYVKELSFAADTKARRSDIVQKGEALYGSMAAVSAALLAGKDVSDGEWKALSKVYGSFEKSETPNDNTVKKYAESLKQAYLALVAYKEGEEKELLNKTQQQLLEALAVYMELVPLRS